MISRDWRYLLVAVLVVVLPLSGLLLLISSDRGQNTRTPATTPPTTSVTGSPAARPSPEKGPAELVHKVDATTLAAAGEAGAHYVVHWGSTINDGRIQFSGPHELRPGSIVLMHFRPSFAQDVAAFLAQAQANGLTPAPLTDYLR